MVGVSFKCRRILTRNKPTCGIRDIGQAPLIPENIRPGVTAIPKRAAQLVIDVIGSERTARKIHRDVDTFPISCEIQSEIEVGHRPAGIPDRTLVLIVYYAVPIEVFVLYIARAQCGITLPVYVYRITGDLFPRTELPVGR